MSLPQGLFGTLALSHPFSEVRHGRVGQRRSASSVGLSFCREHWPAPVDNADSALSELCCWLSFPFGSFGRQTALWLRATDLGATLAAYPSREGLSKAQQRPRDPSRDLRGVNGLWNASKLADDVMQLKQAVYRCRSMSEGYGKADAKSVLRVTVRLVMDALRRTWTLPPTAQTQSTHHTDRLPCSSRCGCSTEEGWTSAGCRFVWAYRPQMRSDTSLVLINKLISELSSKFQLDPSS